MIIKRNKNFTESTTSGNSNSLKSNISSTRVAQDIGVDPGLLSKAKSEASKMGVMMKI